MKKVCVIALNDVPFLPYIHSLLRGASELDPILAKEYEFVDPEFLSQPPSVIAQRLRGVNVLALSCYVWNFNRQMKVARLCKEQNASAFVVAGGPHIPHGTDEFFRLHPYVDVAVHGEGEFTFCDILRELLTPIPNLSEIAGISYLAQGRATRTRPRPRAAKMMTRAYARGFVDSSIAVCKERKLRFYAPWETNRGCPYTCTFCDWGASTMSTVRQFPMDDLLEDIRLFGRAQVPNVFICDANFGMLTRDLELAHALADCHDTYGFPKQVRVNFAKNSNDRVFEISKLWAERDMLMGTTLSLQSKNIDVLRAIRRDNIGTERYAALQVKYASERIHTYTELILGLPEETKQSFIQGIDEILNSGNHEDLRVYEFGLLPNAPANDSREVSKFGLRTINKQMYLVPVETPMDERERVQLVVESNSLTKTDWVTCAMFAQIIQFLHNGSYTRYVAIYLRRSCEVSYQRFYQDFGNYFLQRPETVLGRILCRLKQLYSDYLADPDIPQVNLVASQPDMLNSLAPFGCRKGWSVSDWAWLNISHNLERFMAELRLALVELVGPIDEATAEVLEFQRDIMLTADFDPEEGKICEYAFDWPEYWKGKTLEQVHTRVTYLDTHMGVNRQYQLKKGDLIAFAKAAVGESYPFVRIRHYQHQLNSAQVCRETREHIQKFPYDTIHA